MNKNLLKLTINCLRHKGSGYTLIEFLTVIAILSFVLFPIYEFMRQGALSWQIGENSTEVIQNARIGLEYMTDELRNARQLYNISNNQIRFWYKDFNFDDLATPDEIITYSWAGTPATELMRQLDSESSPTPVAELIDNFMMEYQDQSGIPTADPATVTLIGITLRTSKLSRAQKYETNLRSCVYLRNLKVP